MRMEIDTERREKKTKQKSTKKIEDPSVHDPTAAAAARSKQ